ncbi:MAG: hypothetical protein QN194_14955 [Armatimonadota bacterium]|nr:hypothetical protein [Armatimonadota bacterium]
MTDEPFGATREQTEAFCGAFEDRLAKLGFEIVTREIFTSGSDDLTTLVRYFVRDPLTGAGFPNLTFTRDVVRVLDADGARHVADHLALRLTGAPEIL